jgi:hypothetical protein
LACCAAKTEREQRGELQHQQSSSVRRSSLDAGIVVAEIIRVAISRSAFATERPSDHGVSASSDPSSVGHKPGTLRSINAQVTMTSATPPLPTHWSDFQHYVISPYCQNAPKSTVSDCFRLADHPFRIGDSLRAISQKPVSGQLPDCRPSVTELRLSHPAIRFSFLI